MKKFLLLNLLGFFLLFNLAALVTSCGKAKKADDAMTAGGAKKNGGNKAGQKKDAQDPAKAAENRIKCANNLKQIANALVSFSNDHQGRLPWHLFGREKIVFFGEASNKDLGTILGHPHIQRELGTPLVLVSPCDPDRQAAANKLKDSWEGLIGEVRVKPQKRGFDPRNIKPIATDAVSYAFCLGGDFTLTTVLTLTRNISGPDLKGATFEGGIMKGLKESQGQLGTTDGAALQLDNKGLAEKVKAHTDSRGGVVKGAPSTLLTLPK